MANVEIESFVVKFKHLCSVLKKAKKPSQFYSEHSQLPRCCLIDLRLVMVVMNIHITTTGHWSLELHPVVSK